MEPEGTASESPKPLVIGVPREIHPRERRVALVPQAVERLKNLGAIVRVQSGAGLGAAYQDQAYLQAGAEVMPDAKAIWAESDLVLKVRAPMATGDGPDAEHEADALREGATLVSFVWPAQNPKLLEHLTSRKVTVLAMDCVPRITRAQKLDALSAMANLGGYRAVLEAAVLYGRPLGGQSTAAGRIRPANVLVVGAGVAGLAAIGAARSLGAQVRAFDTRPVVREQVESMGARFVEFRFDESGEGEGGYAKQVSDAYLKAEQELLAKHCEECSIVITTALVPGVPAPKLIHSGAVIAMQSGSVIVDLAAEQGGNCALTTADAVVEHYGVKILGATDLPSRMAPQSSELYAGCLMALLDGLLKGQKIVIDEADEIHRGMLVVRDGVLKWPPPKPILRPGAPRPNETAALQRNSITQVPPPPSSPWPGRVAAALALLVLLPIGVWGPRELVQHLTVFLLAVVVGWHVIWNVTPALHTPLMSVTNAISGIIVVGAMISAGTRSTAAVILGAVAALLATINVAGGFLVTQRMLKMFRR